MVTLMRNKEKTTNYKTKGGSKRHLMFSALTLIYELGLLLKNF